MATYTTSNRLEKQVTGANRNTWGTSLNTQIDMIDDALSGITTLAMTGNVTLSTANGATDQARKKVINITSTTGNHTITIPAVQGRYIVRNAGSHYVTIKTASGTGVVALSGASCGVICDGTDCYVAGRSGWGLALSKSYTDFSGSVLVLDMSTLGITDAKLVVEGWRLTTTPYTLIMQTSDDGATYSSNSATLLTYTNTAERWYGVVTLDNITASAGSFGRSFADMPTDDQMMSQTAWDHQWRHTSGIKYLRLTSGGGTPLAGTFKLYGK